MSVIKGKCMNKKNNKMDNQKFICEVLIFLSLFLLLLSFVTIYETLQVIFYLSFVICAISLIIYAYKSNIKFAKKTSSYKFHLRNIKKYDDLVDYLKKNISSMNYDEEKFVVEKSIGHIFYKKWNYWYKSGKGMSIISVVNMNEYKQKIVDDSVQMIEKFVDKCIGNKSSNYIEFTLILFCEKSNFEFLDFAKYNQA